MPKNPYNFTPSTLKGKLPDATGDVIFVDSATGSVNGDGSSLRPFDKLESAFNKSGLSSGDTIFLMPNHTETVTAAAGIDADVAGVRVVGLGVGSQRPKITFSTATTADMDIDAANISFENIVFDCTGIDAVAAPIDVNATYATFIKCEFILATASAQATLGILTDANASGLTVKECKFLGTSDAGTATAIRIVGGDEHVIEDSYFVGAYTTTLGAIDNNTTASLRMKIWNNAIQNLTASSTKAMVFVSTSTGTIKGNSMQILSGTAPITGAAMTWAGGNYYAATIATAGTLI